MKFSYIHISISVALSFLVLFSSLSLTIEKHFCGGVLIDMAIFSESEKCNMGVSKTEPTDIVKTDCCKDEIDVIEGLSEITIQTFEDFDSIHQQVLVAYSYSYINLFEDSSKLVSSHIGYSPLILTKDIHLLDEVFLI